jgi:hypothetical protein
MVVQDMIAMRNLVAGILDQFLQEKIENTICKFNFSRSEAE